MVENVENNNSLFEDETTEAVPELKGESAAFSDKDLPSAEAAEAPMQPTVPADTPPEEALERPKMPALSIPNAGPERISVPQVMRTVRISPQTILNTSRNINTSIDAIAVPVIPKVNTEFSLDRRSYQASEPENMAESITVPSIPKVNTEFSLDRRSYQLSEAEKMAESITVPSLRNVTQGSALVAQYAKDAKIKMNVPSVPSPQSVSVESERFQTAMEHVKATEGSSNRFVVTDVPLVDTMALNPNLSAVTTQDYKKVILPEIKYEVPSAMLVNPNAFHANVPVTPFVPAGTVEDYDAVLQKVDLVPVVEVGLFFRERQVAVLNDAVQSSPVMAEPAVLPRSVPAEPPASAPSGAVRAPEARAVSTSVPAVCAQVEKTEKSRRSRPSLKTLGLVTAGVLLLGFVVGTVVSKKSLSRKAKELSLEIETLSALIKR